MLWLLNLLEFWRKCFGSMFSKICRSFLRIYIMVDFSRVDFERLATNNKILGEGAGGVVHGPITLNNNIEYAIKRVWFKKDQYDSMRKKIATKANIWMSLENRNLMKIHFVQSNPNVLFLLMEYAAGGSLSSTL